MSDILVKNAPEDVHNWLKTEARRNRRSMNAQIIICLEMLMSSARERPVIRPLRLRGGHLPTWSEVDTARKEGRK